MSIKSHFKQKILNRLQNYCIALLNISLQKRSSMTINKIHNLIELQN